MQDKEITFCFQNTMKVQNEKNPTKIITLNKFFVETKQMLVNNILNRKHLSRLNQLIENNPTLYENFENEKNLKSGIIE